MSRNGKSPRPRPTLGFYVVIGFVLLVVMVLINTVVRYRLYVHAVVGVAIVVLFNRLYKWWRIIPTYSEDDILIALDPHEWKRALEIRDCMAQAKGVGTTFSDKLLREPNIGWLYTSLNSLESQGFVESRLTLDDRVGRAGRGVRKFRLTSGGLRRRSDVIEKSRRGQSTVIGGVPAFE